MSHLLYKTPAAVNRDGVKAIDIEGNNFPTY